MIPCQGLCSGDRLRADPSISIRHGAGGHIRYDLGWKYCKGCAARFLAPLLVKCPCCGATLRAARHAAYRPGSRRPAVARY